MTARSNDSLVPGTRIEITQTNSLAGPTPEKILLLLIEVSNVWESHMGDGKLYDLAVLYPNGNIGHMVVHEMELDGTPWFNSRLLKFVK